MENKIYIKPRQSGKTTRLVSKYMNSHRKSYLIVINEMERRRLIERYHHISPHGVISVDNIERNIRGMEKDVLYIDEYLFFNEKQKYEIYNIVDFFNLVIVETTAGKLYNKSIIDSIKMKKSLGYDAQVLEQNYGGYTDYIYNLLTHPNFEIASNAEFQDHMTKQQFETEIQGNLFLNEGA